MDLAQLLYAYRRPYSWLLHERLLEGLLFQSRRLDFDMELQTQTNWCWAATSKSVSEFYWLLSTWTQCSIANGELGRSDCCNSSVPSACNVPWFLDRALTRTNNFVSIHGVLSFETVRAEIDAGRPVGARIGWSGGGGHFMVIYGYSILRGVNYFDIDDPIYGKSHLTVADFSSNYQGSGSWTHTYITKSYIPIMVFKPLLVKDLLLRRIWEARPLLHAGAPGPEQEKEPDEAWRSASLALAHRVYALGLDALVKEKGETVDPSPVALRVLESANNQIQALFDVTEDDEPRVQQMSAARPYLERLSRGLGQALSVAEQQKEETELRLLRVPALNFEALWLHAEGERGDRLVPIVSLGRLKPFEPVSMRDALQALRKEARAIAKMEDTMGA